MQSSSRPASSDATHEALLARALLLHGDVQGALQEGFAATLSDLQQLRAILGDATGKLSLAFQAMLRQAHDQQAAANRLHDAHDPAAVREIQSLAGDIAGGSRLVVQGLQFEDMAAQLLQHVDRRLEWLADFAKDAAPLQTAARGDIIGLTDAEFAAVEARLADHQSRVHRHKAVQQDSLDEGDVELFGF